jgi:uncharacterized membrane protein (DUF2068 family)
MKAVPDRPQQAHDGKFLRVIAVFKLIEALTLLGTGLATRKLLDPSVVAFLQDWADKLTLDTEQRIAQGVLGWVTGLGPRQIRTLGIGAFVLTAVFLIEGVGLWLRRTWAEWLTVVATSLFIPLEIAELLKSVNAAKVLALVVNAIVVVYLIRQIRLNASARVAVVTVSASSDRST